ncbi:MAG: protein kinase [Bradymonadales bacterium]|nr:protein kinase [Bradymonadales bacterium]
MSSVWKAQHEETGQEFALKILHDSVIDDKTVRQRFFEEGLIQARISHPNVVAVKGRIEEHPIHALVMEYVDGPSLKTYVEQQPAGLHLTEVKAIATGILSGLNAAHRRGIIHRDVKPQNVILARDYHTLIPKLTDFGIAKVKYLRSHTIQGAPLGTPHFMSPEQIRDSHQVTHLTDIYSLGVTLYYMVTQTYPFDDEDFNQLNVQIKIGDHLPASFHRPGLPESIDDLIEQCMAQNPKDRPQNVREVLERVLSSPWVEIAPDEKMAQETVRPSAPVALRQPGVPPRQVTRRDANQATVRVDQASVARGQPGAGADPSGLKRAPITAASGQAVGRASQAGVPPRQPLVEDETTLEMAVPAPILDRDDLLREEPEVSWRVEPFQGEPEPQEELLLARSGRRWHRIGLALVVVLLFGLGLAGARIYLVQKPEREIVDLTGNQETAAGPVDSLPAMSPEQELSLAEEPPTRERAIQPSLGLSDRAGSGEAERTALGAQSAQAVDVGPPTSARLPAAAQAVGLAPPGPAEALVAGQQEAALAAESTGTAPPSEPADVASAGSIGAQADQEAGAGEVAPERTIGFDPVASRTVQADVPTESSTEATRVSDRRRDEEELAIPVERPFVLSGREAERAAELAWERRQRERQAEQTAPAATGQQTPVPSTTAAETDQRPAPAAGSTADAAVPGSRPPEMPSRLTPVQINRSLRARRDAFRACFQGSESGPIEMRITIRPDGTVSYATSRTAGADLTVVRCLVQEITRTRFHQFEGGQMNTMHTFTRVGP